MSEARPGYFQKQIAKEKNARAKSEDTVIASSGHRFRRFDESNDEDERDENKRQQAAANANPRVPGRHQPLHSLKMLMGSVHPRTSATVAASSPPVTRKNLGALSVLTGSIVFATVAVKTMKQRFIPILAVFATLAAVFLFVWPDGLWDDDAAAGIQNGMLKEQPHSIRSPRHQQAVYRPLVTHSSKSRHSQRSSSAAALAALESLSTCVLLC